MNATTHDDPVADAIDYFPLEHYQRPGLYRRRIRIATSPGEARADLEDDPHRYGVIVRHDGECITAAEGIALRTPWDLCRKSTGMLGLLAGMPLSPDAQAVYRHSNGRAQCTHLFDLAGLAAAHAARGTTKREYDIEVPCIDPDEPRRARLRVDGREVLRWTLERNSIVAPEPFSGQDVRTVMPWAKSRFIHRDTLEAVMVLRRAIFVAGNRMFDMDRMARASSTGHVDGACYVFRRGVADLARRVRGSTLDFGDAPGRLLADLTTGASS
jgi:hypothetical protein